MYVEYLNILRHSNRCLNIICVIGVFSVLNRLTWETSGIKKSMNYTQYCNSSCIVYYLSKAQVYNIYNENNMAAFTLHPGNDELLGGFFFQGVGDSSQGFANFILYCALTDKVRERVFVAIFLRKPNHHSIGNNSRQLRASTVETQPSSHEVTRTEEVVN